MFVCDRTPDGMAATAWKNGRGSEERKMRYFLRDYKENRKKYLMSEDVKQEVKF